MLGQLVAFAQTTQIHDPLEVCGGCGVCEVLSRHPVTFVEVGLLPTHRVDQIESCFASFHGRFEARPIEGIGTNNFDFVNPWLTGEFRRVSSHATDRVTAGE